ncbi:putative Signal peptide peptidase [Vibrio phage 51E28.1]|nr:putative Signal peptide peptidase [Vibrio phage 51E28.4]QZI92927.1 putative Signal peptide peptidase [Vibrio phage 51E28.1]
MVFTLSNIWLGTQDSLDNVIKLNGFLQSPTQDAKAFFGLEDEEEDEPRFKGIGSHLLQVEDGVGILRINGSLTNRYSFWNKYFGVISYDEIRDAAVSLANDEEINSILLEIDTGGGAAHGLSEVADLVRNIDTNIKPVEAHTSMYVFSAGMWLASSARKITASPISEQGSIGVIITMMSYHELYKKAGIETKVVRAGKYKALGQPTEPLSEEVIAMAEEKADKLYGYFLDAMVRGRPGLSIANKDVWAEGKTFFADQALPLGLIDEIQSFDKVVAKLSSNYDNTDNQARSFSADNQPTLQQEGDTMAAKGTKKTVLSSEAKLAAAQMGAEVEGEELDPKAEEQETEEEETAGTEGDETTEGTEGEEEEEETPEGEASNNPATPEASVNPFAAEFKTLTKDNAKLELQVEGLEKDVTSANAAADALKPIAIAAVNRMQIALGQTPTDLSSMNASAIADMFTKTDATFNETFSVGGPRSAAMQENRGTAENVQTSFCPIHKPTK